jgi:hypothetical protein
MGARWYSQSTCRFLSEDPVSGEMEKPLTRNPYPYCADDPVNYSDPTGKRLVEGVNATPGERHYTMESLMAQAEKEGTTPGEIARRKGLAALGLADTSADNTAKIIQQIKEKINAVRMAAIRAGLDKPLQQGLTLGHLAPYIESLTYEYDLLQAIENSDWDDVRNLVIDMGESGKFTEQQVQFFLSQSGIDQGMQDTLINIFREAEQGLYYSPGHDFVGAWKSGRLSFNLNFNLIVVDINLNISNKGFDWDGGVGLGLPGLSYTSMYDPNPDKKVIHAMSVHGGDGIPPFCIEHGVDIVVYEDGSVGRRYYGGWSATWDAGIRVWTFWDE